MRFQQALLVTSLSSIWLSYAYANTSSTNQSILNAGTLNKQLEQYQAVEKIKPTGEHFKQDTPVIPQTSENVLQFNLSRIKVIAFEGEEVAEDLSVITNNYLNKQISLSDLQQLTQQITQYYRQKDYFVARAILPPQDIVDGTLYIAVIKGQLGETNIDNKSKLRTQLAQRVLNSVLEHKGFLHKTNLEKLALRLNDLSGVKANLSLKAGKEKAKTDLTITLEDTKRFSAYALLDNLGSTETGRYRLSTGGRINNLLGFADDLKVDTMITNTAKLKNIRLDYSGVFTGQGTKVGTQMSHLHYQLGGGFVDLAAEGTSSSVGMYLSHPLMRLPNLRLNTKLTLNHQHLVDRQNAVGTLEKRNIRTANLAVNGSWKASQNGTAYINLGTTLGQIEHTSNDNNATLTDGDLFATLNYSLSYEHTLPHTFLASLGASGQFASKNLDSSQKMLLGGQSAVRGYRSSMASVDEGHLIQVELKHHLPLFQKSILSPSIFYDYGIGKYYKYVHLLNRAVNNNVTLQSVGVNLSLFETNNYHINFAMAKPVGRSLQGADKQHIWFSATKTF